MEGLLSFLVFGVFFYLMMRYGCGAHMVHGHAGHESHTEHPASPARATDPVCGMTVAPGEGYTKMEAGRAYRFCSTKCLDAFEANPGSYRTAA